MHNAYIYKKLLGLHHGIIEKFKDQSRKVEVVRQRWPGSAGNHHFINFYHIKTIGIVWDASNPEDFNILTRFHQKMAELNKEVKIFGYFPGNEFPDKYTAIRYLTCLKKKEVNFFYCPVHPDTESFIKTKFDVLIDMNFKKHFPLVYVTSLSQAGLKVGLADSQPDGFSFRPDDINEKSGQY